MSTTSARRAAENLAKAAENVSWQEVVQVVSKHRLETKQANVDLLCAVGKINGALEQVGPKDSQGRRILSSVRHYLQEDPAYAGTVKHVLLHHDNTADFFGTQEEIEVVQTQVATVQPAA